MAEDTPQLFDAAPDLYESCKRIARKGHRDTCDSVLLPDWGMTDCTCGLREAKKAIAYARGDDPLEIDEQGVYEI